MKIAGYQVLIPETKNKIDKFRHINRICNEIENFYNKKDGFDLLVLPELSVIDYSDDSFSYLDDLTEPLFGETYDMFSALAKKLKTAIAYGIPIVENEKHYISHVVVSKDGEYITHYNKIHLAQFESSSEKDYFTIIDYYFPKDKLIIINNDCPIIFNGCHDGAMFFSFACSSKLSFFTLCDDMDKTISSNKPIKNQPCLRSCRNQIRPIFKITLPNSTEKKRCYQKTIWSAKFYPGPRYP